MLCTILCKTILPISGGEQIIRTRTLAAQDSLVENSVPDEDFGVFLNHLENYLPFLLDFSAWEGEEENDDESTDDDSEDLAVYPAKGTQPSLTSSAFLFTTRTVPLFILFHSWKHFLS